MQIVLVNWARIWDGASNGGGVNGYCQALALSLLDRGHEVVSVFGGTTFVHEPAGCFVRRHDDWLGVRVFEFVNSPVMAPSIRQYQEPLGEVSAPELEEAFSRLLDLLRPDIVHFHNVEGFSAGCVTAACAAGARVLFSLHNYHTICPQVYLMQGHRRVCHDFDNGHNCTDCIETKSPAAERKVHADAYDKAFRPRITPALPRPTAPSVPAPRTPSPHDELRGAWGEFKHHFSYPVRVVRSTSRLLRAWRAAQRATVVPPALPAVPAGEPLPPPPPLPLPGHPCETIEEVAVWRPVIDDARGQTRALVTDRRQSAAAAATPDPRERSPLLNIIRPEPVSLREPNDYGRRRAAMVAMLNACDQVLAVSDFVRDKFCALGVHGDRVRTMHIGTRVHDVIESNRRLLFDPPPFDAAPYTRANPRPVRLVFMGYNNYYKGLHVVAESLDLLSPDELRRIELSIYALDGKSIEWVFRRLEPRLARLTFVPGYQYQDIPWMLGGKDLGIVSSVWWDNAPQTVFEFLACGVPVLGAAVGGIPDFIKDGVNGLLFRGNDPADLAGALRRVLADPILLTRLRGAIVAPETIDAHAQKMEELYTALLTESDTARVRVRYPSSTVPESLHS